MRILTLNLWNISEPLEVRSQALVRGIKKLRPDIICLQEVSHHPQLLRLQSDIIAERCNFAHHAYSFSGYWKEREEGLAILSHHPIERTIRVGLPEFPGDMARQVFLSEINCESRRIIVANTHFSFPLHMTRERASQAATLIAALKDYRDRVLAPSVIICGDFNDTPDSPAIDALLNNDHALFDTFSFCHPKCRGHTYSSKNPFVDPSLGGEGRIDYVFAGGQLRLDSCNIVFDGQNGSEVVSDHFGLLCTFDFN